MIQVKQIPIFKYFSNFQNTICMLYFTMTELAR